MLYFDTSFLAPLVLPEATSEKIERFFRGLPADQLAVSHWARVEFSSLLAREVGMGGLAPKAAMHADARFESMVDASFAVLLPNASDFTLAKELLGNHDSGLRAGNALHLAIAKNNNVKAVFSLDKTMIKAGKRLRLPLSAGIRLPRRVT